MKKPILILLTLSLIFSPMLHANYSLTIGDSLEVKIIGHEKLNTKQAIAPDGTISLPLLGRIKASGESLESFQTTLQKKFASYIRNPQLVMYVVPTKATVPTSNLAPLASEPIFIILNDINKKTFEVKKINTVAEAKAWAGANTDPQNPSNNIQSDIKPGDIITVRVGKEPSFWEDNWHLIISTTLLVANFLIKK
jgi:protein involved in polysaccharide export with SLBB domain